MCAYTYIEHGSHENRGNVLGYLVRITKESVNCKIGPVSSDVLLFIVRRAPINLRGCGVTIGDDVLESRAPSVESVVSEDCC